MKRFYKDVSIRSGAEGWQLLLDGKPVQTPLKQVFLLPDQRLAEEIAGEWRSQADEIDMQTMPYTHLAYAAIDRVAPSRGEIISEIAGYIESDLLCYRSDISELSDRQAKSWDHYLQNFESKHGISLEVTSGILPVRQPETAKPAVTYWLEARSDFVLAAMQKITQLLGSFILMWHYARVREGIDDLWKASQLEVSYQSEKWGRDYEAAENDHARFQALTEAAAFLKLVHVSDD